MFKIYKSQDGQFYCTLCNKKGVVKFVSETMTRKSSVKRLIESEQKNYLVRKKVVDLA